MRVQFSVHYRQGWEKVEVMIAQRILAILTLGPLAALPLTVAAQTYPTAIDKDFVKQAMLANAKALKTADIERGSRDASVRLFARTIVRDSGKAVAQLASVASEDNIPYPRAAVVNMSIKEGSPPTGLRGSVIHQNIAAHPAAPRAYMRDAVIDLQHTITLYKYEGRNGSDQNVRAYAGSMLPALQRDLAKAQQYMSVGRISTP
jgi:hypothetical protein